MCLVKQQASGGIWHIVSAAYLMLLQVADLLRLRVLSQFRSMCFRGTGVVEFSTMG